MWRSIPQILRPPRHRRRRQALLCLWKSPHHGSFQQRNVHHLRDVPHACRPCPHLFLGPSSGHLQIPCAMDAEDAHRFLRSLHLPGYCRLRGTLGTHQDGGTWRTPSSGQACRSRGGLSCSSIDLAAPLAGRATNAQGKTVPGSRRSPGYRLPRSSQPRSGRPRTCRLGSRRPRSRRIESCRH
jgi:hypothetical protein